MRSRLLCACQKAFLTSSQTRTAWAWFAFEKAAPGCAHNLCAACAQIPHLPGVACFVRGTRPRTKQIDILFAPAGANSTRFFDSLSRRDRCGHACFRCLLMFLGARSGARAEPNYTFASRRIFSFFAAVTDESVSSVRPHSFSSRSMILS